MALIKIEFRWPDSVPIDQIDIQFIQGMIDRMAQGYHIYGHVLRQEHPPQSLDCLKLRLKKYKSSKNTEFLMDCANFCMMEFMRPSLKGAYFQPTTKKDSPGAVIKDRDGKKRWVKGKEDF